MIHTYKNVVPGDGPHLPAVRTLVDNPSRSKGVAYWDDSSGNLTGLKIQGRIVSSGPWVDLVTMPNAATAYEFTLMPFVRASFTGGTGTTNIHLYW